MGNLKIDKRNDFDNYKDEHVHERIVENKNFIHDPIILNPLSIQYKKYWKEQKRRCMEGYWCEGKWMPGNLYFYINFCKIKLNKDNFSTSKIIGRPFLRDLEWEKAYVFMEARGFSGFKDDDEYTCLRDVEEINNLKGSEAETWREDYMLPSDAFNKKGELKKFIKARYYLRKIHSKNLGKPLFQNQALNCIDIECRGSGKDLVYSTLLHYEDGSKKPISKVKIGDVIIGGDGKPTTVKERVDFNNQMQYEITFATGRKVTCGGGHLWTVFFRGDKKTLSLDEIRKSYYWERSTGVKDFKYAIPIQEASQYNQKDPNIDPYYLGLWLGDGSSHNCGITTMDEEIVNFLHKLKKQENLQVLNTHSKGGKASTYVLSNGRGSINKNPLKDKLNLLNLIKNKHVPQEVLHASVDYRMEVLKGLMDSDGYTDGYNIEICTSYDGLKKTIPELLGSLGIKYKARVKKTAKKDALRISLLTSKSVFKLSRKLEKIKKPSRATLARREKDKIINITPIGVRPSVCIGVDNKDNLFLVDDYIVTHNSYWSANGMILHNFYFDGCYDYEDYWENVQNNAQPTSETLVGAIDTSYSKDLLEKVQVGMDEMVGSQIFQGNSIPSPLSKSFSGSWYSGKQFIIAKTDKKINGKWQRVGSGSIVYHRSFKDDPFAGNGTRPSVTALEEVGFMKNLPEALGAMKSTTYDGPIKFGTIYMFGTGGAMLGGASEGARDVFIDPGAYDCLNFEDVWEDTGHIGYFVPYELGLNKFKDSEGNTDLKKAVKFVDGVRDKLKKGKSKQPLYNEMQNNPRLPSEAFLTVSSNVFPVAELKDHLAWLKSNEQDSVIKGQCGELVWEQNDGQEKPNLKWKQDVKGELTPCWYRMKKTDDTKGCIQIWEHPKTFGGTIPYGLYISGTDPYDQDQAPSTASLGSTYIYKTFYTAEGIYEWPVAEYTARPATAAEHHENVRKLLIYYNASNLYENERNTMKMHFEHKHSLYLLAKTPTILKATEGSKVDRQYGTHMTIQIKNELEIYTRDWLIEEAGSGKLNLHKINSIPLIQELINYNHEGNFDRVIAFMLTICHRLMNYHVKVDNQYEEEEQADPFFNRAFSGKFFNNKQ